MITVILRGRRPVDSQYAGVDDDVAEQSLGELDGESSGAADGRENRQWCELFHRRSPS